MNERSFSGVLFTVCTYQMCELNEILTALLTINPNLLVNLYASIWNGYDRANFYRHEWSDGDGWFAKFVYAQNC